MQWLVVRGNVEIYTYLWLEKILIKFLKYSKIKCIKIIKLYLFKNGIITKIKVKINVKCTSTKIIQKPFFLILLINVQ